MSAGERREMQELSEENRQWWDKDELMKIIENDEAASVFADCQADDDDDRTAFEIKESKMEVIYSDPDTQVPLVFKKIVRNGNGNLITLNSAVEYHCSAYLDLSDEPFDCSRMRGKANLHKLNEDPVVVGLLTGLITMRKGERAELMVKPKMAFGELGVPPRIPGDASILYIVEILKVFDESALASFDMLSFEERQSLPFPEIIRKCDEERKSGNTYFVDKRYKEARIRYNRAIQILEDRMVADGEQEKQVKALLLKLYCNSATVLNEVRKHFAASTFCKKALAIDPNSAKALYHYGKACIDNGNYDLAKKNLVRAQRLKPLDIHISTQLARLDNRLQNDTQSEADLYKKMSATFK